ASGGKNYGVRTPAITIRNIGPKRGHLNFERRRSQHFDDAETCPDGDGPAKQSLDVIRPSVGGHVEILGRKTQKLITNAAARPQGLKARLAQPSHHVNGE